MARQNGNFTAAMRALFSRWYDPTSAQVLHDINNNTPITFSDSGDTTSIHALSADTDSRIRVDRETQVGAREPIPFYLATAGALATQTIFIAPRALVITAISELHATAETAAGTSTLAVFKDTGTNAPGGGATTMVGTFNLKATANTFQTATLLAVDGLGQPNAGITLAAGDRLSIVVGGAATITALAGVSVTVWVAPGHKEVCATYTQNGLTVATQGFFLANRDTVVTGTPFVVWSVKGSDVGTVTIDITHETSTNAPGAGNSILAAALSVKTTANTVANPALTATTSRLKLLAGDRLSIKLTGTPTALAGLTVVVPMASVGPAGYYGQSSVQWHILANGGIAAAQSTGFIADRDYEVVDVSGIWSTLGTSPTIAVTIDKGVTAPGGGTSVLTGTIDGSTTANTANVGVLNVSRRTRLLSQGDLLSVTAGGTLTSLAGAQVAISLLPR